MGLSKTIWASPSDYLRTHSPEHPVMFFSPEQIQAKATVFLENFPGLVTYAVKSNPDEMVLANLVAAGVEGFDVASPVEMDTISRVAPGAAMHYNNPVRARHEIEHAVKTGVKSYAVDSRSELLKLAELVPASGVEISVRFKLPVEGAAYDFGAKFGATVASATDLLRLADVLGFTPSLTFHPGTQCTDPAAWARYIGVAATIAADAGVRLSRLNVGGGFPSHRQQSETVDLLSIFDVIDREVTRAFGAERPALVCEPGRGLVADSMVLATRVRAVRDDAHVFLNDGVYGLLSELPLVGNIDRIAVLSEGGTPRTGPLRERIVFGPTCDSVDKLPAPLAMPADLAEGDFVLFRSMGAYSMAQSTVFNGFGRLSVETVQSLA